MQIIDILILLILLISAVVAAIQFRFLELEGRIIGTLLILTFPQVLICFILFQQKKNNLYIIQTYSLLEFLLLMVYYYRLLFKVWTRMVIVVLTIIGVVGFGVMQSVPTNFIDSFLFILFEAFAIVVAGSLYCLYLFLKADAVLTRLSNFWITVAILFYWTTTYTRNGLYIFHKSVSPYLSDILENFFIAINILFYVALSYILVNRKNFTDTLG